MLPVAMGCTFKLGAQVSVFFPKLPLPVAARAKGTNTLGPCLCDLQLHSLPCGPLEVQPRIPGTSWNAVCKVLGMEVEGDYRLQVSGKNVFRPGSAMVRWLALCFISSLVLWH